MPALCPKTGERLQEVRWRDLQLSTVVGTVKLRLRHGYSPTLEQWVCPARELWGLKPYQRLSPELESRLTYTASETASYEAAAKMATIWGSPVSDACTFTSTCRAWACWPPNCNCRCPSRRPRSRSSVWSSCSMAGWRANGDRTGALGRGRKILSGLPGTRSSRRSSIDSSNGGKTPADAGCRSRNSRSPPPGDISGGLRSSGAGRRAATRIRASQDRLSGDGWSGLAVGTGRGSIC